VRIKLHPDGLVRVNDGGSTVYLDTLENFARDFGAAPPALPEGMTMLTYDSETKVLTYTDAKGNAHPVEGRATFAFGENVAGAIGAIGQAKLEREAAPVGAPEVAPAAAPAGLRVAGVRRDIARF